MEFLVNKALEKLYLNVSKSQILEMTGQKPKKSTVQPMPTCMTGLPGATHGMKKSHGMKEAHSNQMTERKPKEEE